MIYHIADFYADSRNGISGVIRSIVKRVEFFVINSSDATIICTEHRREQIKGASPKRLCVVHNSPVVDVVRDTRVYERDIDSNDYINIAYVGSLTENRFIKELIEACSKNDKVRLNIGGFGELYDYVENESKKFNNISFFGMMKYEDVFEIYWKCDLMVAIYDPDVANHTFSAPNKVYESMMTGTPIIVAKDTSVDRIVEKEKIGFTIGYDITEFNKLMNSILEDKSILKEYGDNAKKAYPLYSWSQMKERVIRLYDDI